MNLRKDLLKRKLAQEQKERLDLMDSIKREQVYLTETLAQRLTSLVDEREALVREVETEESQRVSSLEAVIGRMLAEKA